jgi:hypothetical protein
MRLAMRLQLAAHALSRPSCQKDDTQTGRATAQTPNRLIGHAGLANVQ